MLRTLPRSMPSRRGMIMLKWSSLHNSGNGHDRLVPWLRSIRSCRNSSSSSSNSNTTTTTSRVATAAAAVSESTSASTTGTTSKPTMTSTTNMNNTSSSTRHIRNATELQAYLHQANQTLQTYDQARQLFRQGKLPKQQQIARAANESSNQQIFTFSTQTGQTVVVVIFFIAFLATPWFGKKIATDDEFRKRWIPSWYDFTIPKPDNPWTRDELHEQMLFVQADLRNRAIAGEFAPDKLQALQENLRGLSEPARTAVVPISNSLLATRQQPSPIPPSHGQEGDMDPAIITTTTTTAVQKKVPRHFDMIHPGLAAGERVHGSDS